MPSSRRSRVDGCHVDFIVAVASGRRQGVEALDLVGCELEAVGGNVLLHACHAAGAWYGRDVLAAGQDPGQRGLRRGRAYLGADGPDLVDDGEVAGEVLAGE